MIYFFSGTFSEVKFGKSRKSEYDVAIKILKREVGQPYMKQFIENEIKIFKLVDHPNVCFIFILFFLKEAKKGHAEDDHFIVVNTRFNMKIVKLYDIYETKEKYFLVLQLITGGELFARLAQSYDYSERQISDIVKNIVKGIQHLNSNGIVHRDLKVLSIPTNSPPV